MAAGAQTPKNVKYEFTEASDLAGRDEIKHASRAFSLLLAGGALARVMKLTAGGRGAFTFEGLDRSELLTAFK